MTDWSNDPLLNDLANDLPHFAAAVSRLAERLMLDLTTLEADHVAVRCHQESIAERWKNGLLQQATLLSEKAINGRPIALFELHNPLIIAGVNINIIELPWPGETRYRHQGWEHLEFVLRGEPQTLGNRAMALFSDSALLQPGISFKTSTPRGEDEVLPNPTLAVTDGEVTFKFHPWSLKEIIASEAP